jgi:hypothetical protein
MAQSDEKIARDLVVAWLSHNPVSFSLNNPEKTGEAIGAVYTAVLQAVRGGSVTAAGISEVTESESKPPRGRFRPVGT